MKRKAILLFITGVIGCAVYAWLSVPDAQFAFAESPLRLHILANSDDPADQQLKLLLRDQVISLMEESMSQARDKEEAMARLTEALPALTVACNEFLAPRAAYTARLELAVSDFPDIDYGAFCLPAGKYDALRIILGAGQGHNWWCVLFPPLCFVDVAGEAQAVAPASAGAQAEDSLEVRFKLLELLK